MSNVIFTMLVGLAGAGKSTYAKKLSEQTGAVICSSDEIRKELYGDESIQGDSNKVFSRLQKKVVENLKAGNSVIYDATNVSMKNRKGIMVAIRDFDVFKQAVVIATPIDICLRQDVARDRHVGKDVIIKMVKRFQMPILAEGFDDISIYYAGEEYKRYYTPCETFPRMLLNSPHDCKYHPETIGQHLQNVVDSIKTKTRDTDLIQAAYLHDIGKCFCKEIGEDGEAHYYSHDSYGAYQSLFVEGVLNRVYVSALISWHMYPFFVNEDIEKMEKKFGKEFTRDLMILHEADINGKGNE